MTVIAFLVDKYFENHLVFVEQKCRQPLPAVLRGGGGCLCVCMCARGHVCHSLVSFFQNAQPHFYGCRVFSCGNGDSTIYSTSLMLWDILNCFQFSLFYIYMSSYFMFVSLPFPLLSLLLTFLSTSGLFYTYCSLVLIIFLLKIFESIFISIRI